MSKLQQLVVLSDLHIGSTAGLWPPDFVTQEEVPIGQNSFQKWLWKCWTDLHTIELPGYLGSDPYGVVLNGDAVEGFLPRSVEVMTPNITDQLEAAEKVLWPILDGAAKVFIVKGTQVHTGDREITLGKILGAEKNPDNGQHAFDKLHIDIHGTRCVFRHHMPTAMRPYTEATAFSTELGSERIEAARAGHPIPGVLCMAHRHRHGIFRDYNGLVCVTSAWQGITRHTHRVVGSAVPAPSAIVLDWRNKKPGVLPHVEDWVYKARPPKGVSV